MSNKEKESSEDERVETAKEIIANYSPAGNTSDNPSNDESLSKTDEYGKRKRHVDSNGKKVNPSS
ncbi:MAG: hypothetical protein KIT34_06085 [Cyanobacteria bacterium TGS_CYA1]|nr:hypothetical protein [Cyanobacteria bacterium TGS_CYA1]